MWLCVWPTGGLARPPADVHNAWVKASPKGDPLWPDIQLLFVGATIAQDFGVFSPAVYNLDAYVSVHFVQGSIFRKSAFLFRLFAIMEKVT